MKYNIRSKGLKTRRKGVVSKLDENVVTAKYLILYEINSTDFKYEVYRIDSHRERNSDYMLKLDYKRPSGSYIVYDIKQMPRNFVPLDLKKILDSAYIEELENRRRTNTLYEGWERDWNGTPVFMKGKDFKPFIK